LDGNCSSAISAVANASVITHSSWPVIPFLGIESALSTGDTGTFDPALGRDQDQGKISRQKSDFQGRVAKSRSAGGQIAQKKTHSSARLAAQAANNASDSVI
jgi:hypothetical protein